MTGYQLARASGIARPNVYGVIDRLEKRGAVTRIGVGDGVKYAALPAGEMLARLSSDVDSHLSAARGALEMLGSDTGPEYVWNIDGYDAVLARAESIVANARDRLLLGLWSNESLRLGDALAAAEARGVEVVTLCVQGCPSECGGCRGAVYRYQVAGEAPSRWLMLVADEREVLLGEVSPVGDARAAHTSLLMIVSMTSQYLRNTIATAEIVRSVGSKLPKLLDRDAARALEGPALAVNNQSWMKQLLGTVRKSR
jgi:HTH-type transcriptional regulator, sugar sensing transcriptional regulator